MFFRSPHPFPTTTRRVPGGAALLACLCHALIGCRSDSPVRRANAEPDPCWTYDHGAVIRGDTRIPHVALVFTGGEHGEGTGHILDVLKRAGVKASFFVTGQYLAKDERRVLVRRMVAEGHYVGPHSDAHPLYCAWEDRARTLVTEEFFREDLQRNIDDLRRLGALRQAGPIHFIPPYEWFNGEQVRWARAMGVELFNFTPGSGSNRDWIPEGQRGFVPSETIRRDILAFERRDPHGLNGFLLLLHLGSLRHDKMHFELEPLIADLSRRGYVFVRVDEMLSPAASANASRVHERRPVFR